ncbi:MAG: HAD family hydrolase [Anaerovoracaceae bacterium]
MKKPVIAIMYDFDKTLCTKDMQEYGFIPNIDMSPKEFWDKVTKLTDDQEMDSILAYMYTMLREANINCQSVRKEDFKKLGKDIEYFNGVAQWFDRITKYGKDKDVVIEHYIVSSGIKEIIEGTIIADKFKKIYACEFMYDHNDVAVWPKFAVNYTAKTQFLFRINKGVLDVNSKSGEELNQYTPEDERPIPFRNMVYLGDGITDVPCMKLVKSYGGQSIGVYDPNKSEDKVKELLINDRVNFVEPADYTEGSLLDLRIKKIIDKISAVENMIK